MVDDVVFNLIPLEEMMRERDILATKCYSGAAAVRMYMSRLSAQCCESTYRVVLTDIQMPEIDGFEVSKTINYIKRYHGSSDDQYNYLNKYKSSRKCPVVAITAFQGDKIESQAKEAGMIKVLYKPVNAKSLYQILDQNL